jgi:hypothetical protein
VVGIDVGVIAFAFGVGVAVLVGLIVGVWTGGSSGIWVGEWVGFWSGGSSTGSSVIVFWAVTASKFGSIEDWQETTSKVSSKSNPIRRNMITFPG